MAWQMQQQKVTIAGGESGASAPIDVIFPFSGVRRIKQSFCAISSFSLKLQQHHKHFSECGFDLTPAVESSGSVWAIRVTGAAILRDSSGSNDRYDGHVTITVFAEVES